VIIENNKLYWICRKMRRNLENITLEGWLIDWVRVHFYNPDIREASEICFYYIFGICTALLQQ